MALLDTVERIYGAISLFFRLFLLRLALFINQTIIYRTSPKRSATRTILLLGDSTALGLGDTIGNLGLVSRLAKLLREEREASNLRLFWHIVTAGKFRSKAADWAPGRGLFERTLIKGPFSRADVVVIFLGAHDDLVNDEHVVQHVVRVVEGVVRLGKHAVVSSFPNEYPVKSEEHARVREMNRKLKDELEVLKEENNAPGCGTISMEIEMAKVLAMGNDVIRFEEGFVSLNGAGYRLLAREVYDAMLASAKKVEWNHWKERLTPSS